MDSTIHFSQNLIPLTIVLTIPIILDKSQLIIHNAQFDLSMINHALKRNGIEEIKRIQFAL